MTPAEQLRQGMVPPAGVSGEAIEREPPRPRRHTQPWRLLLYYLIAAASGSVALALLLPEMKRQDPQPALFAVLEGVALYLLWIALLLAGLRGDRIRLRALLGRPSGQEIGAALALGSGSLALMYAVVYLVYAPLSLIAPDFARWMLFERGSALSWDPAGLLTPAAALGIVLAWVLAPLAEELTFRGLLLPSWALRWGYRRAALISSAVFAAWHVEPFGPLLFSLVVTQAFWSTGKLWIAFWIHAAANASAAAVSWALIAWEHPWLRDLDGFQRGWPALVLGLALGVPLVVHGWGRLRACALEPSPSAPPGMDRTGSVAP